MTVMTHCRHGRSKLYVCYECEETARREKREETLYATLDKLADSVNALARTMERGNV